MKNRMMLFLSLTSVVAGTTFLAGSVYAAYAISDHADPISVNIRLDHPIFQVNAHVPDSSDASCSSYQSQIIEVEYGDTISDITLPSTPSFLGFAFTGWYLDDAFTQSVTNATQISSDIDIYAKYTRSNVLFDGDTSYYVSSNTDQIIDVRYLYPISNQIWGISPAKNESSKIDLISASGIYKLSYSNSSWNILRKVGFNAKDTYWWGNDSYVTYAYGQSEDRNSWGDKYWAGTLSTGSAYVSSSQTGIVYIDYSIPYLGAVRYAPGATANLGNVNTKPTNSTNHIHLTNGVKYSKDTIYLYIYDNGNQVGWGN